MGGAETAEGAPRSGGGGRRRSIARLAAVQALYQLEINRGLGSEAVIREFVRDRLGREIDGELYGEADEELFADIVRGVARDRERVDEAVSAALSEEWPLARLETLLRLKQALASREDIELEWIEIPFEPGTFGKVPLVGHNWTLRGSEL